MYYGSAFMSAGAPLNQARQKENERGYATFCNSTKRLLTCV